MPKQHAVQGARYPTWHFNSTGGAPAATLTVYSNTRLYSLRGNTLPGSEHVEAPVESAIHGANTVVGSAAADFRRKKEEIVYSQTTVFVWGVQVGYRVSGIVTRSTTGVCTWDRSKMGGRGDTLVSGTYESCLLSSRFEPLGGGDKGTCEKLTGG